MKVETKIPANELKPVWVSNYYDHPLTGICRINGKLFEFDWEPHENKVSVKELGFVDRIKWRYRQRLFELCVSRSWTYENGKKTQFGSERDYNNPIWRLLFNMYFGRKIK